VFDLGDGGLLSREHLTKTFNRTVEDTTLPPVRIHDLRHGDAVSERAPT
jgi:hypothetical protein